jgi:hypothetical protein
VEKKDGQIDKGALVKPRRKRKKENYERRQQEDLAPTRCGRVGPSIKTH